MTKIDTDSSRRDFLQTSAAALGGIALAASITGCQQEKVLTASEVVAGLTTEARLIESAQSHLKIEPLKLFDAIEADKSGLVKELVKSYGLVLVIEEVEGSSRPLDSVVARLVVDRNQLAMVKEIQQLVSGIASDQLNTLGSRVHQVKEDQSFLASWSAGARHLSSAAETAQEFALKLDSYPNFSFKNSALGSLRSIASGAPTARDVQKLKADLTEVIREQVDSSK